MSIRVVAEKNRNGIPVGIVFVDPSQDRTVPRVYLSTGIDYSNGDGFSVSQGQAAPMCPESAAQLAVHLAVWARSHGVDVGVRLGNNGEE